MINSQTGQTIFDVPSRIVSGVLGDPDFVQAQPSRWEGDVLVEQAIWNSSSPVHTVNGTAISGAGFLWVRFWLIGMDTVVEKYFDADDHLIGTRVFVTMPLLKQRDSFSTHDLVLGLWLTPEERVVLINESEFEQAVFMGALSVGESKRAEYHVRDLTAGIARKIFPPAMVLNFLPARGGEKIS